ASASRKSLLNDLRVASKDPPGFPASVNAADWKARRGQYGYAKFPLILGRDFSRIVGAVGAGVDDLRLGDAGFGVLPSGQEGTYAEKIAIEAAIIAKKPDALSHVTRRA